jgi:hypothetical protein
MAYAMIIDEKMEGVKNLAGLLQLGGQRPYASTVCTKNRLVRLNPASVRDGGSKRHLENLEPICDRFRWSISDIFQD